MDQSHKLGSFEGLRGIAAVIVVIGHLRLTFFATSSEEIWRHISFLPNFIARPLLAGVESLFNGIFAVWLFWIMSGFVLSMQFFLRVHQMPATRAHDYLEDAILRRYPRLMIPAFASVVVAYALHSAHWMRNGYLARLFGEPYASGWLASFYGFSPNAWGAIKSAVWESFFAYNHLTTYNTVLWTMEKEFYGSLLVFAFLGVVGHRSSRFFLYPLLLIIDHLLGLKWQNAFVVGMGLCDLFVNRDRFSHLSNFFRGPFFQFLRRSSAVAAASWMVILVCVGRTDRSTTLLLLGTASVALTLYSTPSQRFLSGTIPLFLGRISFGLYLIHLPIICSFSCWAYLVALSPIGHTNAAWLSSAATLVLCIVCGYLLHILADRPGIRISRAFSSLIMNAQIRGGRVKAKQVP